VGGKHICIKAIGKEDKTRKINSRGIRNMREALKSCEPSQYK
jgi:hypothetical protein